MRELAIVVALCGFACAGCTEANPSYLGSPQADVPGGRRDGPGTSPEAGVPPDDRGVPTPDTPATCPDRAAPQVNAPQSTPHDRFVLRAQAPGAKEIEVAGGGNVAKLPVSASGGICLEIPIAKGATVNLLVTAIFGDGCRSASETVTVVQQEPQPKNLALGKRVMSSSSSGSGSPAVVVDGLYDKAFEWSFFDIDALGYSCDNYAWVAIDLGAEETIAGLKVSYPPDPNFAHYLRCWALYASTRNNPPAPAANNQAWSLVVEQKNQPAGTLDITFAPRRARWVGVLMYEDAGSGVNETFQVTEIEIFGPAVVAPFVGCQ
ncbi:MAG: hypothetical protein KC503_35885 [Myxococcales bacterium]|nr:hypothetical protein [Myxococcales bacterium]